MKWQYVNGRLVPNIFVLYNSGTVKHVLIGGGCGPKRSLPFLNVHRMSSQFRHRNVVVGSLDSANVVI